jgi:hypothetical protein
MLTSTVPKAMDDFITKNEIIHRFWDSETLSTSMEYAIDTEFQT